MQVGYSRHGPEQMGTSPAHELTIFISTRNCACCHLVLFPTSACAGLPRGAPHRHDQPNQHHLISFILGFLSVLAGPPSWNVAPGLRQSEWLLDTPFFSQQFDRLLVSFQKLTVPPTQRTYDFLCMCIYPFTQVFFVGLQLCRFVVLSCFNTLPRQIVRVVARELDVDLHLESSSITALTDDELVQTSSLIIDCTLWVFSLLFLVIAAKSGSQWLEPKPSHPDLQKALLILALVGSSVPYPCLLNLPYFIVLIVLVIMYALVPANGAGNGVILIPTFYGCLRCLSPYIFLQFLAGMFQQFPFLYKNIPYEYVDMIGLNPLVNSCASLLLATIG